MCVQLLQYVIQVKVMLASIATIQRVLVDIVFVGAAEIATFMD